MRTTAIVPALLIPLLALAADRPNVKTGLWEVTTSTQSQGAPPIPADVLAKMPPERRAKMEAMLGAQMAGTHTHTRKSCVTEKDLAKPFGEERENCTSTVVKSTPVSQDISVVCTGEHPSTATMHINTPTPESMNGTVEIKVQGGGNAMTIHTALSGRWLGPSCKKED